MLEQKVNQPDSPPYSRARGSGSGLESSRICCTTHALLLERFPITPQPANGTRLHTTLTTGMQKRSQACLTDQPVCKVDQEQRRGSSKTDPDQKTTHLFNQGQGVRE